MTCPTSGQEERQDSKTAVWKARRLTIHSECPGGHAWHMPLVLKPGTEPAARDCEGAA